MAIGSRKDLIQAAALLILGGIMVFLLVGWLGGEGVFAKISTLKLNYFLLATGIQVAYTFVWAFRWSLIIRAQGHEVPKDIIPITFAGAFFNNITPVSKTGGEPIRGYLIGKSTNTTFEEGMASVVVDRIFDMAPFVLICLLTFALVSTLGITDNALLLVLMLLGLVTASLLSIVFISASMREEWGYKIVMFFIDKLEPLIKRFRPVDELRDLAVGALERFYLGVKNIASNRRLLLACLLLSFLLWVLVVLRLKVVFLSLGADESLLIINVVAVASVFAGFAPFLPGGLVLTEIVMIGLFIALGVQEDISGSVVFVDRIISYWFMTLVGTICSIYLSLRLSLVGWRSKET
jgi:uncharacterized protein (TIRG00374 family)